VQLVLDAPRLHLRTAARVRAEDRPLYVALAIATAEEFFFQTRKALTRGGIDRLVLLIYSFQYRSGFPPRCGFGFPIFTRVVQYNSNYETQFTLAASSGKCNPTACRPYVDL